MPSGPVLNLDMGVGDVACREQVSAGVQGPARDVERVALAPTVTEQGLQDAPAALVQRVAARAHHVEGIHGP